MVDRNVPTQTSSIGAGRAAVNIPWVSKYMHNLG